VSPPPRRSSLLDSAAEPGGARSDLLLTGACGSSFSPGSKSVPPSSACRREREPTGRVSIPPQRPRWPPRFAAVARWSRGRPAFGLWARRRKTGAPAPSVPASARPDSWALDAQHFSTWGGARTNSGIAFLPATPPESARRPCPTTPRPQISGAPMTAVRCEPRPTYRAPISLRRAPPAGSMVWAALGPRLPGASGFLPDLIEHCLRFTPSRSRPDCAGAGLRDPERGSRPQPGARLVLAMTKRRKRGDLGRCQADGTWLVAAATTGTAPGGDGRPISVLILGGPPR